MSLSKYDLILANSKFTSSWIKEYWKLKSEVLYPPVSLLKRKTGSKKKKHITNVGRFFTLGHGKKQEVLIKAFKKLYQKLPDKNWELHLVGSYDKNSKETLRFIHKLRSMAKGYPIFFHLNVDRSKLEDILLKSTIYWHATGYGEKKPIKMEHFGIAVVEAISAKTIPFVYAKGGMQEILQKVGFDENTFQSINELVQKTLTTISTNQHYDWNDIRHILESNFSKQIFENKFSQFIEQT